MFLRLALTLSLALAALPAAAFCGFYVATDDGALYNKGSKVIYTRVNETSVITMSSDYRGAASEFALIVPTPAILARSQISTVKPATVAHLDAYTAPRLVEYFDYDPCEGGMAEPVMEPEVITGGKSAAATRRQGARSLGVTIEREYAVGSYDIAMLSAKQSDGLVTFLKSEGYKIPNGAEAALGGYIKMGMKFFVARVNLKRHDAAQAQELEPLQISFRSANFMLPIQLGKLNADGPQDLLILMLTRNGMVDVTNYPTKRIPTDIDVPVFVQQFYAKFYRAMFEKIAPRNGAVLEYAWDMAWCDPCAAEPLSYIELKELGVSWVRKSEATMPNVFVTRLHMRYEKSGSDKDLMFTETSNRENFQGRYIMNHLFDGPLTCPAAKEYVAETRKRLKAEGNALQKLTGWKSSIIFGNIAKSTPAAFR